MYNFFTDYCSLSLAEKRLVEDVAENIMSYHFLPPINANPSRLTEGQLDRLSDAADRFISRRSTRDCKRRVSANTKNADEIPAASVAGKFAA